MRRGTIDRKPLLALLLLGPVLTGCAGGTDLLSKDADWFSRSGRVFIKNVSRSKRRRLARTSQSRQMNSSVPTAPVPGWPGVPTRWLTALLVLQLPRRRGQWRLVTPNATSCAASVRPTTSICPTTRAAIAWRSWIFAWPAGRHLHLHGGTADIDRARTGAGGAAERRQAEEEAGRDVSRCHACAPRVRL